MRKQYRYKEATFAKYHLSIYHDGELVETKIFWGDDIDDEIDRLKMDGYTYGFTRAEVEEAKQRYERMLANMIYPNEFNPITEQELADVFGISLEQFKKECDEGIIKCMAGEKDE